MPWPLPYLRKISGEGITPPCKPVRADRGHNAVTDGSRRRRADGRGETARARALEALERLAADVERLRLLREHELGVRVVPDEEGNLLIRPVGEG